MLRLLTAIIISLAFLSCRKESTTWTTNWTLPLISDTLNLSHLTNDSTLAVQNGNYILDLSRRIAHISPSEYIKIPDTLIEQKFSIGISSLTVAPGTSFVNNNEDHVFELDGAELKKVRLKSGTISLTVHSPVATTTIFEIELPGVIQNGISLKREVYVPPGTSANPSNKSLSIDLSGYEMNLSGSNGNAFNALSSKLKVSSDPNGNSVILYGTDSTAFEIAMTNLKVDYARGYFGQHQVTDSYVFDSDFLKNDLSGNLDLPNMDLELRFENSIKVSAEAKLNQLTNTNSEDGSSVSLSHPSIGNPITIQGATGSWGTLNKTIKSITFDANNSNIEAFIENLGEQTQIDYALTLNPWGNTSGGWDELFPDSYFDIFCHAQMPLNLACDTLKIEKEVPFLLDSSKTVQVNNGKIHLNVENAFPFQAELKLVFMDEAKNVIKTVNASSPIMSATSGDINSIVNILSKKTSLDIPFEADLLAQINLVKFIRLSITLNTPNPSTNYTEVVSIPANAFLKLNGNVNFELETSIGE